MKTLIAQTALPETALPPEAQELRRQFREWHASFATPRRRMAYIKRLCARIAAAFHPVQIILFGSHAYGRPTPESDVDLLIVMNYEGRPVQQAIKITEELGIFTPVDILLRRPEEVKERLLDGDMFLIDIIRRGKVMYEAKHG